MCFGLEKNIFVMDLSKKKVKFKSSWFAKRIYEIHSFVPNQKAHMIINWPWNYIEDPKQTIQILVFTYFFNAYML